MERKWKRICYTKYVTWHNLFIPHRETHQKAHLISWHGLAIYILLFILLQVGFSILGYAKPGILGTTSNITVQKIVQLTNEERAKVGAPPLSENSQLDGAALSKAQNMLLENYWAHFAPSGRTPWDFITSSGYKFTFAGENLAKNFTNSEDVVSAWMASPTHRDNILNPKYKEMGIAVEDGLLQGQHTTLVVEMFGTTSALAFETNRTSTSNPIVNVGGVVTSTQIKPLVDPFQVNKVFASFLILAVLTLLTVDWLALRKRGVFRISSSHLAHMSILGVAAALVLSSSAGSIL